MNYNIELSKLARKFIEKQPKPNQVRILTAISKLPLEGDIKTLSGKKDNYRLRVGDFRIIYTVQNDILLITVVNIGNRGQIYKNL